MSVAFEDIHVDRVKAALTDPAAVAAFESLMEQLDQARNVALVMGTALFEMRGEFAAALKCQTCGGEGARADQAEQVLEALFTVLPEIYRRFFDEAHTAWADGREHDWDEAKFRAAMSEAIGSHPIVDVAALRERADRAEAALDTLLAWTEEHLDGLVDDDADRDPDDEAIFASLRCIVQGNLACTAEEDYTPAQWQALQTIIDRRAALSAGSGGRETTP